MLICVSGFVVGSPHKVERASCGAACGPGPPSTPNYNNWAKKGSVRNNGEVLKRSRIQTAYELSQDLQDKRIEMLERKYGGAKARTAALTIQRAFRRYTLLKKFAAITAMAKAEKRLSRRLHTELCQPDGGVAAVPPLSPVAAPAPAPGSGSPAATAAAVAAAPASPGAATQAPGQAGARAVPVRSLSLRERRLPRSQSSCCGQPGSQPGGQPSGGQPGTVAEHYDYYPQQQQGCASCATPCGASCRDHDGSVTYWDSTTAHFYSPHESYAEHDMSSSMGPVRMPMGPMGLPQGASYGPGHGHGGMGVAMGVGVGMLPLPGDPWSGLSPCGPCPPCPASCPCNSCPSPSLSSSPAGSVASLYQSRSRSKQVPPDVPKRTSSITPLPGAGQAAQQGHGLHGLHGPGRTSLSSLPGRLGGGSLGGDSGSLTSVHSSGSDSSSHTATASGGLAGCDPRCDQLCDPAALHDGLGHVPGRASSPLWKRKEQQECGVQVHQALQGQMQAQAMQAQALQAQGSPSYGGHMQEPQHVMFKVSETVRKRQYRVGLNLFNKKPERGISYLIRRGFLENSPQGVARFLISRKGLSKQMIGEYLGNLQSPFNMAVLECFADELDLCGMAVDVGLRKFQSHFRMPGEAQKIERLMEVFSTRYCRCNQDVVARLRSPDTVFVLAFAIIMLNTDLHTPNIKAERRMKLEDFIKNLRGIDDCHDIDKDILAGIYDRVKANEFKPGSDHVTQVMKVQSTIVGKKPNMALPHRRLVCYCRLYEVPDPYKKERPGVHQREVFLFNDLLVITKILSKKKNSVTYTFRQSFPLCGMMVTLFDVPYYPFGIRLSQRVDGKVLVTFNARNEHDRCKFAEDLRESVCEMDEMENLRIEAELERQKSSHAVRTARTGAAGSTGGSVNNNSDNRDSGVADVEAMYPCGPQENCVRGEAEACGMERERLVSTDVSLKRSALSNSLLDIHEQFIATEKPQRRGSVGSLDSGMSISFQSTSASTVSRDSSPQNVQPSPGAIAKGVGKAVCHIQSHPHQMQQLQQQHNPVLHPNHTGHLGHAGHPAHPGQPSLLGGLFAKRERKVFRDENSPYSRSTEV